MNDSNDPWPRTGRGSDLVLGYTELLAALFHAGYTRIERDDRLLDVFPVEDREKGIELWERWDTTAVRLLRVRLPFDVKKLQLYRLPRRQLEQLFQDNQTASLDEFDEVAGGEAVRRHL